MIGNWDAYGTLAPHSEIRPGESATYRNGTQIVTGEVLHVVDSAMGQLYIIENQLSSFPDVVAARDLIQNGPPVV